MASLRLIYITNVPEVALIAEKNGVERIMVDLETLGKDERQKNINSVKSHHTLQDVKNISGVLTRSECMVRVNPWNENSVDEIEGAILAGADRLMLPMWKTVEEVKAFLDLVAGRVKTTLLLETKEAVACLDEVLQLELLDEIHIGLNDLHLSYGLTFMFELLSNGVVESLCDKMKSAGIPYGFGGVARLGEGMLPAERVIMEHYRLGSTGVILSRSFCDVSKIDDISVVEEIFRDNISRLRQYEISLSMASREIFLTNKKAIADCVNKIVKRIQESKLV